MDEFERPIATVDIAMFTLVDGGLNVALLRRQAEPFVGQQALIGGYVHVGEDDGTTATAHRVLREKAHLTAPYLEQLYTFSGETRDPRGWSLSVAYTALVPLALLQAAPALTLVAVERCPALPFDHNFIIEAGLERLRTKSLYSSLPAFLMPEEFTLTELQRVYELILGRPLDKAKFRRRLHDQTFLTATGRYKSGSHRPAELYRLKAPVWTDFGDVLT